MFWVIKGLRIMDLGVPVGEKLDMSQQCVSAKKASCLPVCIKSSMASQGGGSAPLLLSGKSPPHPALRYTSTTKTWTCWRGGSRRRWGRGWSPIIKAETVGVFYLWRREWSRDTLLQPFAFWYTNMAYKRDEERLFTKACMTGPGQQF